MPLRAFFALTQHDPLQIAGARAVQQCSDSLGNVPAFGLLQHDIFCRLACSFLPCPALFGITQALLDQLTAATVQVHEVAEVFQQFFKQVDAVGELCQHPADHFFDFFPQRITHARPLFIPADCRQRQFVQQLARRMTTAVEEVAVAQGNFQHRDLQPANQRLHHRVQLTVIQDEVKQHAHQVDHIAVDLGDRNAGTFSGL